MPNPNPAPTFGNVDTGSSQLSTTDSHAFGVYNDRQTFDAAMADWQRKKAAGDPFPGPMPRLGEGVLKAEEAAKASGPNAQDLISARMQKFIDSMMGPVDPNDPVYRGLMQAGVDAAQRHAGGAGLAGRSTLAGTQAASVAQQNIQPYLASRQQAGAQMLANLSNRDISLGNLALGQQSLDRGAADAQWAAKQNQYQAIGSALGTGLGAVAGGYFGGAEGAKMGMQAGSSLGGGLGGVAAGGSGPSYAPAPRRSYGGNPGTGY